MSVSIRRLERSVPKYRTKHGPETDSILLASFLLIGLVGIVPAFALLVRQFGLPLPFPTLIGVGVVMVGYTAAVLVIRRVLVGSAVALIVLSTFAANVPLTSGATGYPGALGPQLWLFGFPLAVLFGYHLLDRNYSLDSFSIVEVAFGGLVLWSVLSALLGPALRPLTALYYSLFLMVVWIILTVVIRTVRERIIDFRTLLRVFVLTACAHAVFGIVQFINQAPLGLTYLGETARTGGFDWVILGGLGSYTIGTITSGFTGGSSSLSMVLVIATPIALSLAFDARGSGRVPPAIATFLCIGVLRLTAKDGARIAVLMGVGTFCSLWVWHNRELFVRNPVSDAIQRMVPIAFAVVVTASTVLFPSTTSGASSKLSGSLEGQGGLGSSTTGSGEGNSGVGGSTGGGDTGGAGGGSGGGGDVSGGGGGSSGGVTGSDPDTLAGVDVTSLSVPYLSLNSLGIRLQQYIAAIKMTIEHPLFGVGGANYPYFASRYGLPAKTPNGASFSLHNQFIAVLAGTGIPGFLAFAIAITGTMWKSWLATRENPAVALYAGVFGGLVAFLAAAFWVVGDRYMMVLPFWIVAGGIIGLGGRRTNQRTARSEPATATTLK